jgi:endonuclease/exonuclease/phosphatase family metal-dependent hydrolase
MNPMILKRFVFLSAMILFVLTAKSQSVTIMTYNIRCENSGDGLNGWSLRRVWLCEQISKVNPGIFGIQEGVPNQVKYIDSALNQFRHIGVGRDDGKNNGEFSAIYYNIKQFKVLKQATFWLSPTPGKVSKGWDAALVRICTYGLFQETKTGRKFWVFNTHFDHIGVVARKNSTELILQKIKTLNKPGYPVILMGDFNSNPDSEPVKIITSQLLDSKIADKSMSMLPGGTFNGFDASKPATERIDFIFTSKPDIKVLNYTVLRESREGRFASDHFPVVVDIGF